ncbi:NAD(P)-dependent oxidoreductase [Crossiella sp. SN42]|uniref:NAD-dependent epimerase/dehydratase family protein n=1 Tax=Crossiella sp. SN42 TaxID=2944808 RepID=UPI00207CD4D2|nr:NAD(P)-dependent oxidoreductase [Crossiella sp. SN42]MCO1576040.1 NAD(P)-dependent oxidoreductase [Crossiella sp. SN42]
MTRVAVLGGTGWLGKQVCASFAQHGDEVLVVARNPSPQLAGHRFAGLDLARAAPETITELLRAERVDVVVNATDAANATDGWENTEEQLARTNVGLAHALVHAVGALPWRPRLVHMGSILEYGEVPAGTLIDERVRPAPSTPYTRTKLAGSAAVLAAAEAGAVDAVVLRLSNISGPHPSPASFVGKLVAMLCSALDSGTPLAVTVTEATRDYLDVRDAAEAVRLAATAEVTGRVINLGSGQAVTIRELVRAFVAAAGLPPEMLHERNRRVESLGGDWTLVDIGLARALLGWSPRIPLADSLRDMWRTAVAEQVVGS